MTPLLKVITFLFENGEAGLYLALQEELQKGNGLLCAICIYVRHVEVIQEEQQLSATRCTIHILGSLLHRSL